MSNPPATVSIHPALILTCVILLTGCDIGSGGHEHHNQMHGLSSTLSSTTIIFLLATGFLTGLSHCVGMCGPLVSTFSVQQRQMKGAVIVPLLMYQFGRLSTYVLIGLIMGAIGSSLQMAALGQGWQIGLSVFIGIMMLMIGLSLMGVIPGLRWLESASIGKQIGEWMRWLMFSNHLAAPYGLGMANGMLPCGPVYAMALLAATTQSPWHGGSLMLLFGLGTFPAMLGMGFAFATFSVTLRRRLYRMAAALIILIGVQQVLRGLALAGLLNHFHVGGVMIW